MRLVAIVFFGLVASACGHAEEPKAPVPLQLIDVTGPRQVVQALNLGAMDGLIVTRKTGTMLDEDWTVSAKATDEALQALAARGCTAEHNCTVHIVTSKEDLARPSPK
jgi:hypothetical protein